MANESSPQKPAEKSSANRRLDVRKPGGGEVTLRLREPVDFVIRGELVDASARGFRIRHDGHPLKPGFQVEITYMAQTVVAKVIWTRQQGQGLESGFLIL
ncbi:MAG TPA: PilZ domain-containing protein [Terriglobales bacterium]|jgi:hypothetical protein|nr:PilZ domain-containing protein [Terriglobales bacterium]